MCITGARKKIRMRKSLSYVRVEPCGKKELKYIVAELLSEC